MAIICSGSDTVRPWDALNSVIVWLKPFPVPSLDVQTRIWGEIQSVIGKLNFKKIARGRAKLSLLLGQ